MMLTKEEEKILDGEYGFYMQKAMRILVALGDIYGAERLIPIRRAHIAGASYITCGDAGLSFLEELSKEGNAHFNAETTLNPVSMVEEGEELNIPINIVQKQQQICDAYLRIGAIPTYTCIPHFIGFAPIYGEHVAMSESSVVIWVNSMIGARTNREGGISALAAAIIGKTPEYGFHLNDRRKASVLIINNAKLKDVSDYSAFGYHVGMTVIDKTPAIMGIKDVGISELKSMLTAMAVPGAVSLAHIIGLTPEARSVEDAFQGEKPEDKISVEDSDIDKVYEKFNVANPSEVDCVYLGCPHLTLAELRKVCSLLKGKKVKKGVKMLIAVPKAVKHLAYETGLYQELTRSGAQVISSVCEVTLPLKDLGIENLATNSAKCAHYSQSLFGVKPLLKSTEECIKIATGG